MGLWGSKPTEGAANIKNQHPMSPMRADMVGSAVNSREGGGELRRLTGTEEYVSWPRLDGHPSHIIVSVAHISGLDIASITKEQVALALHCTAQRFLALRSLVSLDPRPGESRFIEVTQRLLPILVNKATTVCTNDDWKTILYSEILTYCPGVKEVKKGEEEEAELPWKLYFLKQIGGKRAAIVHCADHLVEDGRSTLLFFSEFLKNLSKVVSREISCAPDRDVPLFDQNLSSQDRCNDPFSYLQTAKDVVKEIYRSTYANDQPPQTPIVPVEQRHYALEFVTLNVTQTAAVLAFSKRQGVTVTSMLASMVLTAAKQVFEPGTTAASYYTVILGVDLRPHYKPLLTHDAPGASFKDLFGSHIDVRRDTYGVGGTGGRTTLVQLAKRFDVDTKAYVQSGRMTREKPRLERYIPPIKTLATKNNGRVATLHFANLGVWKLPAEASEKFNLDTFYCTAPTNLIGGTIRFNVQTVNDRLNLTFTFVDEIVPRELRQAFMDHFMGAVKDM